MQFELGLSYDQLEVGMKASWTKTITETDVYLFAGITGDFNPMHVNEEFAKQTPFGTRIAHGGLPQSLIAPVLGTKLPGLGTVAVEITTRFKAPTRFGDTVTASAEVVEKLEEKHRVRMELLWTNQRGEIIGKGEAIVIPPPKVEDLMGAKKVDSDQQKREEKNMAFTSAKEIFDKMPEAFNPSAAAGMDAVFQFHITGGEAGDWHIIVKDNACQVNEGTHDSPSVSLTLADADWVAMCNGELDGMSAFMSGKLKATGNIMMAQSIQNLFPLR